ncbi:MAG: L-threonine 3-dehydrogenase [Candidatus Cloacimonetes bacterium]|nr:L-threonine 3-dehydrogenase [Candidatus Cloacimonadota bacterium]
MKRILVVGSAGQIGAELTPALRKIYGESNVVASDINSNCNPVLKQGPFEVLDALDDKHLHTIVQTHKIDTIFNLVALLSAKGEKDPQLSIKVNLGALNNILEVARQEHCAVFTPSSIGAFGPGTPADNTPQDTIQRPNTIYGVTKVAGELLCDYYFKRFGVDTRGLRFPGIISNVQLPGGGTTDYAVEIYYEAIKNKKYTCYLKEGTFLDMMYMPDAINAAIGVMEADPSKLLHRNAFNVTAMSFDPEMLSDSIKKLIPDFSMDYSIDPVKQSIADSWPNSMDDSSARNEWGWNPEYNLDKMSADMIDILSKKLLS